MLLSDLMCILDQIAPLRDAEKWDNVGLIAGDPSQQTRKAMLTIDYTRAVADEARSAGCDLVIAYHPPIFEGLKRIVAPDLIHDAVRRGTGIYSPHTALDVADGGTNDMLADVLGLIDRRPIRMIEPKASQYKLVTFVPEEHLEKVSNALFEAGCGRIGDYTRCSFRTPGTGTFFGEEGTSPTVGQSGRLEQAAEVRIETVLPIARLHTALDALRSSHPYEEPAFDLVQLASPPGKIGQGRIGQLAEPTSRLDLVEQIKHGLGISHLLVAGPMRGTITRAACCAGSCGDFLDDAISQKAELYLTGELRHHDAVKAATAGMTVVCTLHSNSERAVLRRLQSRLAELATDLDTIISTTDHDPFTVG